MLNKEKEGRIYQVSWKKKGIYDKDKGYFVKFPTTNILINILRVMVVKWEL